MCGARASDRVSALHRILYLRCPPESWWDYDYCATERDNPALTCIPLTQARVAAIDYYYGPADTCEASARAMHAHVLAPDARARGGVLAVLLGVGLARCSSFALPAGLSNMCVRARARALVCVRECARECASMREFCACVCMCVCVCVCVCVVLRERVRVRPRTIAHTHAIHTHKLSGTGTRTQVYTRP